MEILIDELKMNMQDYEYKMSKIIDKVDKKNKTHKDLKNSSAMIKVHDIFQKKYQEQIVDIKIEDQNFE